MKEVCTTDTFGTLGIRTDQCMIYVGWLHYERDTIVIHFIIYAPGPHLAGPGHFDDRGASPIPAMLTCGSLRSCVPRFWIQSR